MGRNSDFNPSDLVGKTLNEAEEICGWNGYSTRILKDNDVYFLATSDLKMDRVNFIVIGNIVQAANIG